MTSLSGLTGEAKNLLLIAKYLQDAGRLLHLTPDGGTRLLGCGRKRIERAISNLEHRGLVDADWVNRAWEIELTSRGANVARRLEQAAKAKRKRKTESPIHLKPIRRAMRDKWLSGLSDRSSSEK